MANPFNGCSRGVFAVWMPAELSTTQFSMLKPDSTISVGYDPEHTFTTDRSSLQKMETIDSDGSSIRETAMKTFEGCHRGVFALDSWITGDADRFERSSSPPDISTDPHPKMPCIMGSGPGSPSSVVRTGWSSRSFSPVAPGIHLPASGASSLSDSFGTLPITEITSSIP